MNDNKKTIFEVITFILQAPIPDLATWCSVVFDKICPFLSISEAVLFELNPRQKKLQAIYSLQAQHLEKWSEMNNSQPNSPSVEYYPTNIASQIYIKIPFFHKDKLWGVWLIQNNQADLAANQDFWTQIQHYLNLSLGNLLEHLEEQKKIKQLEAINAALEESQKQIHENAVKFLRVHKQLTDSIQYAQKMQKAVLPQEDKLARTFEDYFVIYIPKDVVSGDFYWFSQIDLTFLAVIDCTGHGVPGAFMSMIGNTLLNEIVNTKRVYDPAKILYLLDQGVQEALKQHESNNLDGMDVCLCRFELLDEFQLKVTFAGAKRPLYYICDGQLVKIVGNRFTVGGGQSNEEKIFDNHEFILKEEDCIFLTTDGFIDTPNEQRQSFGKTRLKKLLIQNADKPMAELKKILMESLTKFLGNTQQRDDVTVIGIKI